MKRLALMLVLAFGLIASSVAMAANPAATMAADTKRLMLLSGNPWNPAKINLFIQAAAEQGLDARQVKWQSINPELPFADLVHGFDLVLLDDMGAQQLQKNFAAIVPQIQPLDPRVKIASLPKGASLHKGVGKAQVRQLEQYFSNGGRENFTRMVRYIRAELLHDPQAGVVEPPFIYPQWGIYDPRQRRFFDQPVGYLAWYRTRHKPAPNAPVVGITIRHHHLASENTAIIEAMMERLEAKGAIPMVVYYQKDQLAPELPDWLTIDGKPAMDALINTRSFHYAKPHRQLFEPLGVSVLHAFFHHQDEQTWREQNGGLSITGTFFLTMSEIAGTIEPKVVAALNPADGRHYPIAEQMDLLARKALRLAQLATLPNPDKKVAILYYNSPPGEKNAGASFLNIPRSIEHISTRMKQAGYHTESLAEQTMINAVANLQRPHYRKASPARLLENGMGAVLPLAEYRRWYGKLPEVVRKKMEADWGQPEDHYMVAELDGQKQFVIPMIRSGNLMVLPQPPRGDNHDRERTIYHSKDLAVSHFYLATYLYLRQTFGADALVHLGTHGSHEWLPGKERGLWAYDPGSLATDDLPVIYPYIVDNVGEALQAKRRGHAVMLSHMTPPFAPSGLYRELAEVHELMHQYSLVDPGRVREQTRKQLIETVGVMNIPADMGWQPAEVEARFDDFLIALHDYMHDLSNENQPLGLHTWGRLAEDQLLAATVMQILGAPYADAVTAYLHDQEHDHSHDHHHHDHAHEHQHAEMGDQVKLEDIPGFRLIESAVIGGEAIPEKVDETLRTLLLQGRELTARIRDIMEMTSFLAALDGRFIPPSTGGDPVRSDESLPTGRNLYGFDPSRLPTKAAYESGRQLVTEMIDGYVRKHGQYPHKMAFSLWSTEAMRHHGVLASQVLHAMGLRPVWTASGRVVGTEIIPYSELKRPRIDVVLSATGLYRDALPGLMQLLAEGIEKIANLKEENNYLQRNTQRIRQELINVGIAPEEAAYLSSVRIFSGQSGNYGSCLGKAVLASDTWQTEDRLANLYLDRMGYAFGSDQSRWSEKIEGLDLYGKNLSGTDIALFSRSSNLYGVVTANDPFQYLGGLSLAVRALDGKSPEMFITNLRDPRQQKMETLGAFLSREMRTRYLHPRWIKQMQQEGYAGTLDIVKIVSGFSTYETNQAACISC